jgi:L-malate glycosyltransferase
LDRPGYWLMRVLYFTKNYSTHDHRFLAALAKSEHQVMFLQLEPNLRAVEDRPVPAEIQQVHWAGGRRPFRWRDVPRLTASLKQVIRDTKPHLIHAGPVQTCAFLAALTGFRPLLTMSWGFDLMEDVNRNTWWQNVTRYVLRRSAFFVSDAEVTRQKAIRYGMKPDRTTVFPWGVDLAHFSPAGGHPSRSQSPVEKAGKAPASKRAKPAPLVLLCNRSWEPRYGVDILARAFVRVAQEQDNVSLLLLGGGSLAQHLRQILMNGGVLDRVQFAGQISQTDLPRWYHMADLYISPSHVDGSSVSLMEALACGVPTLISDIPANREWITDRVNGWLFPDGDAGALAERILEVIKEPAELARIARAGRRTAEARADWPRNFSVLLQAYRAAAQAA